MGLRAGIAAFVTHFGLNASCNELAADISFIAVVWRVFLAVQGKNGLADDSTNGQNPGYKT